MERLRARGPKAAPIPDVVGQDEAAAVSTVKAQGFVPDVAKVSGVRLNVSTGKGSSPATTTTKPAASTPAPTTARTTTTSAPGPAPATVTVPDLVGKKLLEARKLIRKAGLVTEFKRVPSEEPKGTVVSQSPKPGTTRKRPCAAQRFSRPEAGRGRAARRP
jgi:beta-lactam-binding protein with PASTA domain